MELADKVPEAADKVVKVADKIGRHLKKVIKIDLGRESTSNFAWIPSGKCNKIPYFGILVGGLIELADKTKEVADKVREAADKIERHLKRVIKINLGRGSAPNFAWISS